ncbi:hypothetical protein GUITHDRAFT_102652 [Guillardia theta CCMP2712]|uniref:Uncharacterized protein n=1 Tax=Guillardia theta (strain CCMP2712) TaxID=905079 RepID=L1JSG7_GUITC|nr:hypothetical protein GUITHDRAFT_102652 [Guillardia theta CCMP2712]EKX51382.1 hypothetical protein GUITHDRAFT_102652 [Guillardia theta CCMP2712]|eukprot:XP_005838362.1 hypothetical protein GUITHDRAFT_102652 [Guillardia theta CCMP2712]
MSKNLAKKQLRSLQESIAKEDSHGKEDKKMSKSMMKRRREKAFPVTFRPKPTINAKEKRMKLNLQRKIAEKERIQETCKHSIKVLAKRFNVDPEKLKKKEEKKKKEEEEDDDDIDEDLLDLI